MFDKNKISRIIICDDDRIFMDLLEEKIKSELAQEKIEYQIEKYSRSTELLENISVEDALYFLDIDMPEVSGMELAEKITTQNPYSEIIFISNYEEKVFESFRYTPLRFIRKRKIEEELKEALSAWLLKRERKNRVLEVVTREEKCCILMDDIIYLESKGHYLQICSADKIYELRSRISDYEKLLRQYGFVRVNIGFIVNCHYIKALQRKKVILNNGLELNIGNNRQEEVQHAYMEYIREKHIWKK